jgi:hypothetical protein
MSVLPSPIPLELAQSVDLAPATCTAGVISDARRRQRHRLIRALLLAMCVGVGATLIVSRMQSPARRPISGSLVRRVAPAAVLARAPDMGVACRLRTCDWVGLAIWLRQPATAVLATIAGRAIRLRITNTYPRPDARAAFVAFLRPFRLVTDARLAVGSGPTNWIGKWPTPIVQLRIRYRDGTVLITRLKVALQPGWG